MFMRILFLCRFSVYFNSAHLPIFGKMYLNYKIGETDIRASWNIPLSSIPLSKMQWFIIFWDINNHAGYVILNTKD